jgi:ubiquinone/menaquinone biosynthesis C-methylase UbiE/uncharacterized protein YbaR (Trm112 family)
MWNRFIQYLQCPQCAGPLDLHPFRESRENISEELLNLAQSRNISHEELSHWVDSGALQCHTCEVTFPVWHGLPILLPYTTSAHEHFSADSEKELKSLKHNYPFPQQEPVTGERFVLTSFSKEWIEYDFDGVIWTANYDDYRKTFLREVGYTEGERAAAYLEVGCGIGITASIAQQAFGGDVLGVDLSMAAMKACGHWKANPFMQFVQASAFYLPVRKATFDIVYSRGALHHTYSTKEAFRHVAERCKPGGRTYLWVYGSASIRQNLFRKSAFATEALFRPLLSKNPCSPASTACLTAFASAYIGFNSLRRLRNPHMQQYTFRRAMHAARDRFTPQFAHRHEPQEVESWFRETGFDDVTLLDWREMPTAEQENFERNIGVLARKHIGDKVSRQDNPQVLAGARTLA